MKLLLDHLPHGSICVLTGAGCSTESGIPDYRGPETARRARNPIQYRAFMNEAEARQRYWARSLVGWPRIEAAEPNQAHVALARLQSAGLISGLITQNVDRLHQKAGSTDVIELHGALAEVICIRCGEITRRTALQRRLVALNGMPDAVSDAESAPDGDAELEPTRHFTVPGCIRCGGVLKPHVVFFGENVPRPRVDRAFECVHAARLLLVVGSSLTVFSGYRFVKRAAERGIPVCILNLGPTRGDPLASEIIPGQAGIVLPEAALTLGV